MNLFNDLVRSDDERRQLMQYFHQYNTFFSILYKKNNGITKQNIEDLKKEFKFKDLFKEGTLVKKN